MGTIFVDNLEPQSGTTLTLGASGDTLTIPSGCTISNSGTASGFGKIGQIVTATTSTEVSNTSTSYADVGLSASITPTSTSSKVFVIVSASLAGTTGSGANNLLSLIQLVRGSTSIAEYLGTRIDNVTNMQSGGACSYTDLDSPSTTSATTYKVQQKLNTSGDGRTSFFCFNNRLATITLMEVLA